MEIVEKLMSAFGGFGLEGKKDEKQKAAVDVFNKTLLEFALKLDSSYPLKNSKGILQAVIATAKSSDTTIIDSYLRLLSKNGKLLRQRDPEFVKKFPVNPKTKFKKMDKGTQDAVWAYLEKLAKEAQVYKLACESNPMSDLSKIKLDGVFGGTLIEIKAVLAKNNVDMKKSIQIFADILDCLPIDNLLSQIPPDLVPGGLLDGFSKDGLKTQVTKLLTHVFVEDEAIEDEDDGGDGGDKKHSSE